jgi:hypothetical protein
MTSTFHEELPVFYKRFSAKLTSKNSRRKSQLTSSLTRKMTSIFDCQFSAETTARKSNVPLFDKVYFFHFFPVSPLSQNGSPNRGYNLSATFGMAHSLDFKSVTPKSPIL